LAHSTAGRSGATRHQKGATGAWSGAEAFLGSRHGLTLGCAGSARRATSLAAAHFLDALVDRMPFPIAALQVDGGSEFAAEFETACQQRNLPLFVLPPRSPKLNGQVERSHRTHHEEFYQVIPDR